LLNAFYVFCHETARVKSALPILAKVVVLVGLKLHERVVGVAAATAVQGAAVEVGHALSRIELAPEKKRVSEVPAASRNRKNSNTISLI